MSEELEYILNKNDYYLKQRGLLKDNWNTNLNNDSNPFNEMEEKKRNEMTFYSTNNFYPKTTSSFRNYINNLDYNNSPFENTGFTYYGNPNEINTNYSLRKNDAKKLIEKELENSKDNLELDALAKEIKEGIYRDANRLNKTLIDRGIDKDSI